MSEKITKVTLGTDPEVFLGIKGLPNDVFYPVCGLVGGTKKEPRKLSEIGDGFMIQEDNVMLEFNVPPASTGKEFSDNIGYMLEELPRFIPKFAEIKIVPSAFFQSTLLQTPKAQEFGCDPDYNAWTNSMNTVGQGDPNLRTAGGHVMIGYENSNADVSIELIKAMDLFLGIPSILLDTDTERRKVYGKAGAFRLKPFGVEYRVLSNFWIKDYTLRNWIFNSTMEAIAFVNSGKTIAEPLISDIQLAINTSDKELCQRIMDEFDIVLPEYKLTEKKKVIAKTEGIPAYMKIKPVVAGTALQF